MNFSTLCSGQTGLELVLQWICYHGLWNGSSLVRKQVVEVLQKNYSVKNEPPKNTVDIVAKLHQILKCKMIYFI